MLLIAGYERERPAMIAALTDDQAHAARVVHLLKWMTDAEVLCLYRTSGRKLRRVDSLFLQDVPRDYRFGAPRPFVDGRFYPGGPRTQLTFEQIERIAGEADIPAQHISVDALWTALQKNGHGEAAAQAEWEALRSALEPHLETTSVEITYTIATSQLQVTGAGAATCDAVHDIARQADWVLLTALGTMWPAPGRLASGYVRAVNVNGGGVLIDRQR